jgi:molybdopterin converting factor small subunit
MSLAVIFHIPGALRGFTNGGSQVAIEGSPATLADALSALWILHPGLRDRVTTEQGQIRQHINIFVGHEDIRYTGGLRSRLSSTVEIFIVPAVSGGGI